MIRLTADYTSRVRNILGFAIFHFSRRSTCSKKPHKQAKSTAYEVTRFPRRAILLA